MLLSQPQRQAACIHRQPSVPRLMLGESDCAMLWVNQAVDLPIDVIHACFQRLISLLLTRQRELDPLVGVECGSVGERFNCNWGSKIRDGSLFHSRHKIGLQVAWSTTWLLLQSPKFWEEIESPFRCLSLLGI